MTPRFDSNFENTRFLVVDEFSVMRKIVTAFLRQMGARSIEHAGDGGEAFDKLLLAKYSDEPIDFIVSDWSMPNVTGLDLLVMCRENPALRDVPFVLLTAEGDHAQVAEALRRGVDGYVLKPMNRVMLEREILSVWSKRSSVSA